MSWEIVSITDLEAQVSPEVLIRGREYQKSGHILRACRFDRIIAGEVAGTGGTYRVRLTVEKTQINGVCNCPYPSFCKHMVALALAWIEKSIDFINLDIYFNRLCDQPKKQQALLFKLIQIDPINLLDLLSTNTPEKQFLNSRGVLNLIRNTFQGQMLTHDQIEAFLERIERIKELVVKAVTNRQTDAPELLLELLRSATCSYREYQSGLLKNYISELILLGADLSPDWPEKEFLQLLETLWDIYLDNSLWDLSEVVRAALAKLYPQCSYWLLTQLEIVDWEHLGHTKLVAFYELLNLISERGPVEAEYVKKVIEVLNQTIEGKLWLIDRIIEDDLERAFSLAKEGIRNCNQEDKQFFRERLIEIHRRRNENKQAAALSFIQFKERPNLEEYLRLKAILAGRSEFQVYLVKLKQVITESDCLDLTVRIAFDQEDWENFEVAIKKIDPTETILKELAEIVSAENRRVPLGVFEMLAIKLLMGGRKNWEIVQRLLISYKKCCLKYSKNEEWKHFSIHLSSEYGEDRRFIRKFGAILTG